MSAHSPQINSSSCMTDFNHCDDFNHLDNNHLDNCAMLSQNKLVVGIVAGEVSGDKLGAVLMQQMQSYQPNIEWVGVGGQHMQAQGLSTLFELSELSVMGLVEVIKHLPSLIHAKNTILSAFANANIDVFIGIDAPDFNLRLGKALKSQLPFKSQAKWQNLKGIKAGQGVFCVQYVSPSIWAWREGRIKSIKQATDLVLCLFPFELDVYQRHQHPAVCVGHPLLDDIKPRHTDADREYAVDGLYKLDKQLNHKQLNHKQLNQPLALTNKDAHQSAILCVMPGSRVGEITAILPKMLTAVCQLLQQRPNLTVLIPTINAHHAKLIHQLINEQMADGSLQQACHVLHDPHNPNLSHQAMLACDVVLLASGTATFEAMLLQRPMVVVYQLNALTYHVAKRLIKVPYVALPNILANQPIVPELIQNAATPSAIADAVDRQLIPSINQQQQKTLQALSDKIRQDSRHQAAKVVLEHYWHNWHTPSNA